MVNEHSVPKYDFIDTLRGLAILGVILVHTAQWIPPASPFFAKIGENGALGVQLFFITSALTLFLSLASRRQENAPVRNFFIRRFFRIAPIYYLALVLFFCLDGLSKRQWDPHGIQWWYALLTLFFLNGWHPNTINAIVPGGWSIVVEMTFYLCVPFLFARIKTMRSAVLLTGFSLVLAFIMNRVAVWLYAPLYAPADQFMLDGFTFFWFFSQLPVFALGILAYQLFVRLRGARDPRLGYLLLGLFMFLGLAFLDTQTYLDLVPHHFLMSLAFLCLVFGLHFTRWRLVVNPVTIWVGKISYSMYLVHFVVLRYLQVAFPKGFPLSGNGGTLVGYLVVTLATVIVSGVTYRVIELPGIDLGKALIARLELGEAYHRLPVK